MPVQEFIPGPLRSIARSARSLLRPSWAIGEWGKRGYAMPAPNAVKWAVLHRYGGAADTWIETGTCFGDTTDFLARSAKHVYSVEPEPSLANRAMQRFASRDNVTIVLGLSEEHIGSLIDSVTGPVSFWLDGHFSTGVTFQGPIDTPIQQELDAIAQRISGMEAVTVCVDDVRCFDPRHPEYSSYPNRSWLVQWADSCGLRWTIEHDIFIATNR